ncbi:glycosyltransferase family 4 protein [Acidobacteriota bacterium]
MDKKILIYGQIPPPQHGSNIMTLTLSKALERLHYKVKVSNKRFSKQISEVNKITVIKFFRFFSVLWSYSRDLIRFRPDLVVFFVSATKIGLFAEGVFTTLTRIFHIPYVLYIHNNGHKAIYWQGHLGRWIVGRVFNKATACLVLGEVFKKDISSFYNKKIYVLPNCLMKTFPERRYKSDQSIHVLYLSNLYESKGIFTLIRAIPKVLIKNKRIMFLIGGPWQDKRVKKRVLNYVHRNKIGKNIQFLGGIYGSQKEKLFQKSDIFVFPSHYPFEAFGLVNIEAMQVGMPVITTNIGALSEMVLDGRTGYIIPPKNPEILSEKINLLVNDPKLRRKMGKEGKERFNTMYSFDAYSSNVQEILLDLFQTRTIS